MEDCLFYPLELKPEIKVAQSYATHRRPSRVFASEMVLQRDSDTYWPPCEMTPSAELLVSLVSAQSGFTFSFIGLKFLVPICFVIVKK